MLAHLPPADKLQPTARAAAVHQGRVDAFTYEQTQSGAYGEIGDLPARCPKVFVPLHRPTRCSGLGVPPGATGPFRCGSGGGARTRSTRLGFRTWT